MSEKHNTDAATFEIHMDAKVEINMLARMTECGLLPAFSNINAAILFAFSPGQCSYHSPPVK